jgi:hypothetical protein
MIGFDPCKPGSDTSYTAVTVMKKNANTITPGEVVATYISRPHKSIDELYQECRKIAKYYGAGIIPEKGPRAPIITEDAEVVSVETVHQEQKLLRE